MGQEAICEVRFGKRTAHGKARLEAAELRFVGAFRFKILLKDVSAAEAKGGELRLAWPGGTARFALGPAAEKWALKIRHPRSRLDKLGIKPGARVALAQVDDAAFLAELSERTTDLTLGRPRKDTDVVVVGMTRAEDVARLAALRQAIRKNGAIWVVWPKGRQQLREDDVRAAGLLAGLVDVKVMSFSDTLSALKMVIPLKER